MSAYWYGRDEPLGRLFLKDFVDFIHVIIYSYFLPLCFQIDFLKFALSIFFSKYKIHLNYYIILITLF